MYLLVNVLEQIESLPAILAEFAKIGIKGSTVINSTGMGRVLMQVGAATDGMEEIKGILSKMELSNKTIFTVVPNRNTLKEAIGIVKSFCGDLTEPGKGILFAFPLEIVEGVLET
jgi:nitrogen regulatory protein PII